MWGGSILTRPFLRSSTRLSLPRNVVKRYVSARLELPQDVAGTRTKVVCACWLEVMIIRCSSVFFFVMAMMFELVLRNGNEMCDDWFASSWLWQVETRRVAFSCLLACSSAESDFVGVHKTLHFTDYDDFRLIGLYYWP